MKEDKSSEIPKSIVYRSSHRKPFESYPPKTTIILLACSVVNNTAVCPYLDKGEKLEGRESEWEK